MENRATKFTDNFHNALDMFRQNKPKDLAVFVYIYARDPNTRDDNNPDWVIAIEKMCNTKKYDDYYIRHDIDEFLIQTP